MWKSIKLLLWQTLWQLEGSLVNYGYVLRCLLPVTGARVCVCNMHVSNFSFFNFFLFLPTEAMKTFKIRHPPFQCFSKLTSHSRSRSQLPKWLKIYDINKNTKRTTLTRKTRAAAPAEQREEIPQQEMFSGPVRFRLDGCAKPQGTHPSRSLTNI